MLQIKNVRIATNRLLIENVTLQLDNGYMYGVSAPNGTGKSTLMRTIAGLLPVGNGEIILSKRNQPTCLLTGADLKKELFYFENTTWLDGNLTGLDYLELINQLWHGDQQLIEEAIDFWDLSDYVETAIKNYSLGMKQKILLSLYVVSDTSYWFLDEPTLGLDRKSLLLLEEYFLKAKKAGKMIFFSSHTGDRLFKNCEKIFSIEEFKWIVLGAEGND